jgi:hypothetical protein
LYQSKVFGDNMLEISSKHLDLNAWIAKPTLDYAVDLCKLEEPGGDEAPEAYGMSPEPEILLDIEAEKKETGRREHKITPSFSS